MSQEINPAALYWAIFNCFELRLPGQCVIDCAHSGDCGPDVEHWTPQIQQQVLSDAFPNGPTLEKIREELSEYGAWDSDELADDAANWERLVWIAAGNISDDPDPDCSDPIVPKVD